jgi:hypothetical protein
MLVEQIERRREAALSIALATHVLECCPIHEDAVFEGKADITHAYKLGNHKLKNGELNDYFDKPRELTDAIKEVVEEYSGTDCCGSCSKD